MTPAGRRSTPERPWTARAQALFSIVVLLFLFLLGGALTELYLLAQLAGEVGFLWMVATCLLTAAWGSHFARREGLRVWEEYQGAMVEGRVPNESLIDGLLVLIGGACLIVPGLITDGVGLLLLLPWTRHLVRDGFGRWLRARIVVTGFPQRSGFVSTAGSGRARARDGSADVVETTGEACDVAEQDGDSPRQLDRGSRSR